jgi:hypothetical protein
LREKALGGVDADYAEAEAVAEHFEGVLELVFAQQASVDEDVGEAVADGAMDENGGNCGIDTAAQRANDAAIPYFGANCFGGFLDESGAAPFLFGFADAEEEIAEDFGAAIGVADLGMKFDGINFAVRIFDGRNRVMRSATVRKPGGRPTTWSPWLFQMRSESGNSAKSSDL